MPRRAAESRKPENERLFYDPYTIRFASKEALEFAAKHPEEAKALAEKLDRLLPGVNNSMLANLIIFPSRSLILNRSPIVPMNRKR